MNASAASQGMATCHACGLLSRLPKIAAAETDCPRCGSALHLRKRHSVMRTWALLLTAYVLYIPANLLPVMETTSLGSTQNDTILSGVVYLWNNDSWDLAVIVFIASIIVPMAKLLSLTFLVISVQARSHWQPAQRTKLYRMVELIGKWSMLDIYVAAILTTLVNFGTLSTIKVGNGAIAFGAVVVVTLLAARSFDPRLIWDQLEGVTVHA